MLNCKTFYSIPNWLDLERLSLPVIVSGGKPASWHCSEISHLSAVCLGKKALKKPDQKPDTLPPDKANNENEAHVVSPTVRASALDLAGDKPPTSILSSAATTHESKAKWLTVEKNGRKIQPAGPLSRKLSQVDTNSSSHLTNLCQKTANSSKSKHLPKIPP